MRQVNLYEAKTQLSALVEAAAGGEEVVIAKNGKPRAKLVPVEPPARREPRRFGFWAKYDWEPPEVFPETTEEEIAAWEDGPVFPED
jgi:prevent-host-death family protein